MAEESDPRFEAIRALADDPRWPDRPEVLVERGYLTCIHIWFISVGFAGISEQRRRRMAWRILRDGIDEEVWLHVTLLYTLTPDEFADYFPEVAAPLSE